MHPNRSELQAQADMMAATGWRTDPKPPKHPGLAEQVADVLERNARGGSTYPDGLPASGWPSGPGGHSGDVSDRTGTTAVQAVLAGVPPTLPDGKRNPDFEPVERDPYGDLANDLAAYWGDMVRARKAITNVLEKIRKYDGGRRSTVDACAEPSCMEPATKSGRCEPCYKWRQRWSASHAGEPAPPVPTQLIEDRRKPRRQHVA